MNRSNSKSLICSIASKLVLGRKPISRVMVHRKHALGMRCVRFLRSVCRIFTATAILFLQLPVLPSQAIGQETEPTLDRILIQQTVETVGASIRKEYFDAKLAATVDRKLQERLAAGSYSQVKSMDALATELTHDLLELTKDKHLTVSVVQNVSLDSGNERRGDADREMTGRRSNFGVQRAEILAGNVGYLNLTAFFRPNEARDAIEGAMRTLRRADALILECHYLKSCGDQAKSACMKPNQRSYPSATQSVRCTC
jgi:hypothetical protein